MQFAFSARLVCVYIGFICVNASRIGAQFDAKQSPPEVLAERLVQRTAIIASPAVFRAVAENAYAWADTLKSNKKINVPLDELYTVHSEANKDPGVQAALSYGALRAALHSKTDTELQQHLLILSAIATPHGLVYKSGDSRLMPILLLANGQKTVRLSIISVVCSLTANLYDSDRAFFAHITYAIAAQYVLYNEDDRWEALTTWLSHRPTATISVDLLVTLAAALGSRSMHMPPQPADEQMFIGSDQRLMNNLQRVVKEVVKHASPVVQSKALGVTIYKPILSAIFAEVCPQESAAQHEKQIARNESDHFSLYH